MVWAIIVFSFLLSILLTWWLTNPSSRFYILDTPNERSLHATPIPRSGGLAILVTIIVSSIIQVFWNSGSPEFIIWIAPGLLLVSSISYLDDKFHVSVIYRLIVQSLSISLLLVGGLSLQSIIMPGIEWAAPFWIGIPVSMLFAMWMINLYNFMDGIDGFASGMAICGFGVYSVFGWMAGNEVYAITCASVASAAAGFLCFNFPPARIFMGDTGSSTLGFLAASLSLWGIKENIFPLWITILVFSPFIVDATVTLMRRLWNQQKIWQPHKTHFYQKLVLAGWGHRRTVLFEYAIMFLCGLTALISLHATALMQVIMITGWVLFYIIFFFWVSWYAAGQCHDSA